MHSRYVDAQDLGWYSTADANGDVIYAAAFSRPPVFVVADFDRPPAEVLATRTRRDPPPSRYLDRLEADRGPLRPVQPITEHDQKILLDALSGAGRRAITTLAAAVEQLHHELRQQHGGLTKPESYDRAVSTLTAGRSGSWESNLLVTEIIPFGNRLNLAKPAKGRPDSDIAARRAAGPSRRVDVAARDTIVTVLNRWVTAPDRYTEVAETLAAIASAHADDNGGWSAVADQWLQPTSLAHADFSSCYRLFYSLSAHYDFSLA